LEREKGERGERGEREGRVYRVHATLRYASSASSLSSRRMASSLDGSFQKKQEGKKIPWGKGERKEGRKEDKNENPFGAKYLAAPFVTLSPVVRSDRKEEKKKKKEEEAAPLPTDAIMRPSPADNYSRPRKERGDGVAKGEKKKKGGSVEALKSHFSNLADRSETRGNKKKGGEKKRREMRCGSQRL